MTLLDDLYVNRILAADDGAVAGTAAAFSPFSGSVRGGEDNFGICAVTPKGTGGGGGTGVFALRMTSDARYW